MIQLYFLVLIVSSQCLCVDSANAYQPQDVCFLTDHEPIPKERCSYFAKVFSESGLTPRELLPPNFDSMIGAAMRRQHIQLFKSSKEFLSAYNQFIPCLNRHYACEAGYSFIMPSSPRLTILQNSTRIPNLHIALDEMSKVCNAKNVTLPKAWKGDIFKEVQRSQTWCKVLLMERLMVKFPACKIAIFLDADILIMPPKEMTSVGTEHEAWVLGTTGLSSKAKNEFRKMGINSLQALAKAYEKDPVYFQGMKTEEYVEFGLVGRAKSELVCANGDINRLQNYNNKLGCETKLHQLKALEPFLNDPRKLIFTSSTNGGPTFGHEQWMNPALAPKNVEEALLKPMGTWNNVDNTMHSTSFMVMKNTKKTIHILRQWWESVDPNFNPDLLDARGQPLRIYRTSWAHEQRVSLSLLRCLSLFFSCVKIIV
jgi:hypothetical protein